MKRILLLIVALALTAAAVGGLVSTALASSWTDLSDDTLQSYGITNDQVAQISQGFGNGLWRPEQQVTRAQFAKMTCLALSIAQAKPAIPTFTDVPNGSVFYGYIEGAAAAGIVKGVSTGHYAPSAYITREQGLAIIARTVGLATSTNLDKLYTTPQLFDWITAFSDGSSISPVLRTAVVFAANLGVVSASDGDLRPREWLTRIEAASFLTRAKAPAVASVDPGSGGGAGGNTVTITGTGFLDATKVKFGDVNAISFSVVDNTKIQAVVPEGTVGKTVNVVVANPEGSSDMWVVPYTYTYGLPAITSVNPTKGTPSGGNTAIIIGSGFTDVTGVQFGGVDATSFKIVSDTRIEAVVPQGTPGATVKVTVIGPAGTSADPATACSYIYDYPVVADISPTHGPAAGGTQVTITGSGFATLTSSDAVYFGGQVATSYQVVSDTKITAVTPAGDAGLSVLVTVDNQASVYDIRFHYDGPEITDVTPNHGPFGGGNQVVISGTGLGDATTVYFGSLPSPSVSVTDTRITATVPACPSYLADTRPEQVDVKVYTLSGSCIELDNGYEYDIPTVTDVVGADGSTTTVLTITGLGFQCGGVKAVFVGSTAVVDHSVTGDTITATIPLMASGDQVDIVVVNRYGSSLKYTYKHP